MRKNFEKALSEFLQFCKKKFRDELVSIVLFGSYARGTAKEHSDVDLLVIVERAPRNILKRFDIFNRITT